MARFEKNQSFTHFQILLDSIYSPRNDRSFSTWDLISNQERFTMRALKGIRKNNAEKIKINLLVALSWAIGLANRLHVNLENEMWLRFPMACPYCHSKPCSCKVVKSTQPQNKLNRPNNLRPQTLGDFQKMFEAIYPSKLRTLADAGIHLAEEMGEVSEALHQFSGEHKKRQFNSLKSEIVDYLSCAFGVANSSNINLAEEVEKMYQKDCPLCHESPCECSFSLIARFES